MTSSKLKGFIEADMYEKAAISAKKELRDYVGKLLRRCQRQGIEIRGIIYTESERFNFNEDLLYEWVKTQVDKEALEELTKKTIDIDKLHQYYLEGKINTENISEDVYKITKYFTIKIDHKKVGK